MSTGLTGKSILVTRATHQAEEFMKLITLHGGHPVVFPTIEISPPDSWEICDRALEGLYMYDGLIFTSINGVDFFTRRMVERDFPLQQLLEKKIFVVGEKTKQAIEHHGCTVTGMPDKFTSVELSRIMKLEDLQGMSFLFPRGNLGSHILSDHLKILGAHVDEIIVYKTEKPKENDIRRLRTMLLQGNVDMVTFTSPSTIKNFLGLFSPDEVEEIKRHMKVAVIGPVTAKTAGEFDLTVDVVAEHSSVDSLVQSLLSYFQSSVNSSHREIAQ